GDRKLSLQIARIEARACRHLAPEILKSLHAVRDDELVDITVKRPKGVNVESVAVLGHSCGQTVAQLVGYAWRAGRQQGSGLPFDVIQRRLDVPVDSASERASGRAFQSQAVERREQLPVLVVDADVPRQRLGSRALFEPRMTGYSRRQRPG